MHDLLFVYGSLLSVIAHSMGERMRREAALVGAAHVQGQLYAVTWYPGVALSANPADRVEGELYRLRAPAATLAWLDEYEGLAPGPTGVAPLGEYERILTTATLADGTRHAAWIYHYRKSTSGLRHIPSGRWTDA
jgi:gamma-glutamylcyclotransferase (GGCT)/AIG2-like uncharacterized protein YtfP